MNGEPLLSRVLGLRYWRKRLGAWPIPTGWNHSAQGCEERATLGALCRGLPTLKGLIHWADCRLSHSTLSDATLSGEDQGRERRLPLRVKAGVKGCATRKLSVLLGLLALASTALAQFEAIEKDEIVTIGKDVLVKEGETVRSVVVISGSATIKGTVRRDVVVVAGSAVVEGAVKGDLVVVAGDAKLGPEAEVRRDVVVIGGPLDADPTAKIGREKVLVSGAGFGWVFGWVTKGLMWARPMPPQFAWAWMLAGLFLLGYVLLALIFPRSVQVCVDTLHKQPLGSFFLGLLVFILFGPLVVLLAISVIGIVIIPFLLCAMVAAFLFGKVAVYRYTGQQIGSQVGLAALQEPLLALVLGAVLFYLLYTIPVVGFIVWGVILPLGVGAAVLAFFRSFRVEAAAANGAMATGNPTVPGAELSGAAAAPAGTLPPLALPRVGFWRRLMATLLDFILLGMLLRLFHHHVQMFFLMWLVYHIAFWGWKGTTIGGIIVGIKIVRTDGRPIDFAVALVRGLGSIFSAMALFLGFFWAGWDRDKQSWHDKIAGTIVVKAPKDVALI